MDNPIAVIKEDAGFVPIIRTLGCIGDSLASGEHESLDEHGVKGYHDYYEYSWGQFMARKCGLTAYNFSVGGMTAKEFASFSNHIKCFTPEKACQAYIIALGVNDISQITKNPEQYPNGFGETGAAVSDDMETNTLSVMGTYVNIIKRIRLLVEDARIFVVTPPHCRAEEVLGSKYYDKFTEELRKLPEFYEYLYVIDLRKYAPIYDLEFENMYFCGGHMNAMGYKFTADMFTTYMDYIIKHNIDDFKQIAFVGKGLYNVEEKRTAKGRQAD